MGYKITAGGAQASIAIGNDGIGTAEFTGLLLPGNLPAIGVSALGALSQRRSKGAIYRLDSAVVCSTPPKQGDYNRLTVPLRGIPVAFVVNAAQVDLYRTMVRSAASNGLIRAAFRCPQQAQEWVRDQVDLLREHRAWLEARQAG